MKPFGFFKGLSKNRQTSSTAQDAKLNEVMEEVDAKEEQIALALDCVRNQVRSLKNQAQVIGDELEAQNAALAATDNKVTTLNSQVTDLEGKTKKLLR